MEQIVTRFSKRYPDITWYTPEPPDPLYENPEDNHGYHVLVGELEGKAILARVYPAHFRGWALSDEVVAELRTVVQEVGK